MKKIVLALCLLLLVSCGTDDTKTDLSNEADPSVTPPVQQQENITAQEPEKEEEVKTEEGKKEPETIITEQPVPERTPEEQVMDKKLITLLREQLDGAYDVKGATFTYTCTENLEGKECFAYKMVKGEVSETFAVATDSSAIFHLDGKDFVKIFG